jgi:inorganic pyrophosphatase
MIIFVFQSPVGGLKWESVPCEYETAQECPSTIAYAFFTTMAFILGALISTLS